MHARLVLMNLGQGQRETAEKVADEMNALAKTLKGFKSITFFMDEAAGEYGGFSLWETKEDGEAGAEQINPRLGEMVGNLLKGEPTRKFFEVYEPKG